MNEVTRLLNDIDDGDGQAAERLLPLVYEELRKLAARKMAQEPPGQTLQATALVHEAYLRLVDRDAPQQWASGRHFFAAAAEAMRRILVERARHKRSLRAGGDRQRCDLDAHEPAAPVPHEDILALDEALRRLAERDARKARLVELRYFVGMTSAEAAEVLGISAATADRNWAYARAWLHRAIAEKGCAAAGD